MKKRILKFLNDYAVLIYIAAMLIAFVLGGFYWTAGVGAVGLFAAIAGTTGDGGTYG